MTDERLKKIFKNVPTDKFDLIKNTFGIGSISASLLSIINSVPVLDYSLIFLYIVGYFIRKISALRDNKIIAVGGGGLQEQQYFGA